MKKNISNLLLYLTAIGLFIIGLGVVYYAFEMVSIPHVHEYNEMVVIVTGLILTAGGVGLGAYKILASRRQPATPEIAEPQTG